MDDVASWHPPLDLALHHFYSTDMVVLIARRAFVASSRAPLVARTLATTSLRAEKGPVDKVKETVDVAQKELGKKLASG
jgi:hypothetical protein